LPKCLLNPLQCRILHEITTTVSSLKAILTMKQFATLNSISKNLEGETEAGARNGCLEFFENEGKEQPTVSWISVVRSV
jgi:hypothetical protein